MSIHSLHWFSRLTDNIAGRTASEARTRGGWSEAVPKSGCGREDFVPGGNATRDLIGVTELNRESRRAGKAFSGQQRGPNMHGATSNAWPAQSRNKKPILSLVENSRPGSLRTLESPLDCIASPVWTDSGCDTSAGRDSISTEVSFHLEERQ